MVDDERRQRDASWPRSVYGVGEEPDPRFTLANERTFLAWLRTALALMAGGVGVEALARDTVYRDILSVGLLACGVLSAVVALLRWARVERAMRTKRALPPLHTGMLLTMLLTCAGGVAAVLVLAV